MSEATEATEATPVEAAVSEQVQADAQPVAEVDGKTSADEPKAQDRVSRGWARITRQEARLREEREQAKAEREAFKAEQQSFQKRMAEIEERERLLKEDPAAWFEKHAPENAYEMVTRRYLNDGQPSQEELFARQQDEIQRLRQELTDYRTSQEQASLEKQEAAYRAQLNAELAKDDYELIKAFDAADQVEELVVLWAEEKKELLTPAQAAAMVEAQLEETLPKLSKTSKFTRLAAPPVTQQPTDGDGDELTRLVERKRNARAPLNRTRTLTNGLTTASPVEARRPMTRKQRIADLAAKMNGWGGGQD